MAFALLWHRRCDREDLYMTLCAPSIACFAGSESCWMLTPGFASLRQGLTFYRLLRRLVEQFNLAIASPHYTNNRLLSLIINIASPPKIRLRQIIKVSLNTSRT